MISPRLSIVTSISLIAIGCASGPRTEREWCRSETDARTVIVFWDQSLSATHSPSKAVFADSLQRVVEDALQCPGNTISGFFVHARTPGKAYRVRQTNRLAPPRQSGSRIQLTQDSIRYALDIEKLVQETWASFTAMIDSTRLPAQLTSRTDLLGSLEVLSSELADAPEHAKKTVYYFSDMYESMTGPGRRDFDARPPRSYAEAEEWARADLEFVRREMNVDPSRFSGVEVRVLTEGLANRPNADQVRRYWEVLFAELGFERVRFN